MNSTISRPLTRINLLPWRKRRQQRHRQGFCLALAMTGLLPSVGLAYVYSTERAILERDNQHITQQEQQIALLKRSALPILNQAQKEQLAQWQRQRTYPKRALASLSALTPEHIALETFSQQAAHYVIKGMAHSIAAIDTFAQALRQDQFWQQLVWVDYHFALVQKRRVIHFTFNAAYKEEQTNDSSTMA